MGRIFLIPLTSRQLYDIILIALNSFKCIKTTNKSNKGYKTI